MPISDTKPTVTVVPGDTIVGQECIFAFLPTGGSETQVRAKVASLSPTIEKIERKAPDGTGLLATDRTVVTGKKWSVRLTSDEFSAAWVEFINDVYRIGTGKLFILDPDDATDTASIVSNEFSCTVSPDGETSFQADQFSESSLIVDINGTFTLNRDVDVS
jgi:hypothetical protein